MYCRIDEMRNKQVVSVKDGGVLGFVSDIELDTNSGKLVSIIILGRPKMFGFLGREDDIVISWEQIEVIGKETILVNISAPFGIKTATSLDKRDY